MVTKENVLMFFVLSISGWVWEVVLHFLRYGELINRGVLHGPWLPIYGSGGILILLLLNKLRKYPIAEFAGMVGLYRIFSQLKWKDMRGKFIDLRHGWDDICLCS